MRPGDARQWRFRAPGSQVRAGAGIGLHNQATGVEFALGSVLLPEPSVLRLPLSAQGPGVRTAGDPVRATAPDTWDAAAVLTRTDRVTVAEVPAGGAISLHRPGSSPRPICGGEQVAVRLAGAGYLVAGEPGSADLVISPEPGAEWVVTGVAPGVAVPVGKPVGLFDTVHGDHLVCIPGPELPVLGWASGGGLPEPTLPIPPRWRPPEGVPGDVELSGAVIPVRDGDLAAGLLLLLDPADGRELGTHLVRRVPDLAEELAPDAAVGAVACRWSSAGEPGDVEPTLPPAGARLWVQGVLVADPGVTVSPVRALAWALDADGEPVTAMPGGPDWPQTVITWHVLLLPLPDDAPGGHPSRAFHLPLPVRDGEPGTTTTITPLGDGGLRRNGDRGPVRNGLARNGLARNGLARNGLARGATSAGAASPALVAGTQGSRRVLRTAVSSAHGYRPVVLGCTVRVHVPSQPTGA